MIFRSARRPPINPQVISLVEEEEEEEEEGFRV